MSSKRSRPAGGSIFLVLLAVVLSANAQAGSADEPKDNSKFPFGCPVKEGYVNVTGGKVWYEIVGGGDAIPLVTVHGGPGFTHDYLEPIGKLCRERPVIFYDQLGAGKSDHPHDKSLWTLDRFVKELAQVRSALGLKRAHFLGHSAGTLIVTDYALTQPQGVVSLTFSDALCSYPEWSKDAALYRRELPAETRAILDRHEASGYTDCPEYQGALIQYYKLHVCRLPVWPDSLERSFAAHNDEIYVTMQGKNEFSCTGNLKDWDRTARLKEIKAPSLYIAGRLGSETSVRATTLCHNALPGSEMVIFEESSHMPMYEEPDKYLRALREFMHRSEQRAPAN
ncbi:MAG TPA: proline iminopeptidase-family hydrolase [Candidatus Binataceae bacterium]|nr:proline iminopeptidase-family hydrolase [Candidatus Binataceae bacterium]